MAAKTPKITSADARRMREILPEEKKAVTERRLKIIEDLRGRIMGTLLAGRPLSKSIRRKLEHLGPQGAQLLSSLTASQEKESLDPAQLIDGVLGSLRSEFERLGGSTRQATIEVLKALDLRTYWFGEAFDSSEGNILMRHLFPDPLPVPPSQFRALDLGSGIGRASVIALYAMETRENKKAQEAFAPNIYAVDLMARFVEDTRTTLAPFGVPAENVVQGDFLELPPDFQEADFDVAWASMHTLFHCTTQRDLERLFGNVERALKRKGRFMFDSVGLYHHQGNPTQENLRNFNDLKNLYGLLVRRYRRVHIDPQLSPEDNPRIFRFPVVDRTARVGYYPREVLTTPYIDFVLHKMKSRLKRLGEPIVRYNQQFPDDLAIKLGLQWIEENDLKDCIMREIVYRFDQMDDPAKTGIEPFYHLSSQAQADYDFGDRLAHARVKEQLEIIAREMVKGYVQKYYILGKE